MIALGNQEAGVPVWRKAIIEGSMEEVELVDWRARAPTLTSTLIFPL